MNRRFLFDDAALGGVLGRFLVVFDEIHTFDDGALLPGIDLQDRSLFTAVFTAQDYDAITFLYLTHVINTLLAHEERSVGRHAVSTALQSGRGR